MHTSARRSVDRPRVADAAHPNRAARLAPAPVSHSTSTASGSAGSLGAAAGAATRADALGAILARAVVERAQDRFGTARHAGATLQRFLGLGKKKKPARPAQALPAPPRPKQDLPAPDRPTQALPPSAAASPSIFIPGAVPQAMLDLGAGKFDLGSELDPFEARQFNLDSDPFEARQFNLDSDPFQARQFNLDSEAPAATPPPPAAQDQAPAAVAPVDDGYAPELVPDETGLIPVAGNPYLEWLVSTYASDRGTITGSRSYGALRNLQVIASLSGYPPPRPIDRWRLAPSSTARDWGFEY